jgi:hypothetical protein
MPDMAIQVAPKDIEHIIKQIEKLQQLAKEGIVEANKEAEPFLLSAKEKGELSQFEEYENTKQKIKDEEQHLHPGAPGIAKVSRGLIKLYKANLERIGPSYNAVLSRQLKHKDQEAKRKYKKALKNYFIENIKPDWNLLDISLYAQKEALGLLDYQIVNQIQGLLNVEKCHVASDQQFADVILKLRKIKARLEVERQQQPAVGKPAETGRNEIVEVKPGAFGINVNIKEIARRIWKLVCSRRI